MLTQWSQWSTDEQLMLTGCATGELMLNIPSFLNVEHDATTQKTTLSISDPENPHQRAMWGMFLSPGNLEVARITDNHA